jgi:hypothetical protein
LRYLLLLELLLRPPTIMLIDLLAMEQAVGVACLRWGRQVALVAAVFRLLVITSSVITTIIVPASTAVVVAVVVVATRG